MTSSVRVARLAAALTSVLLVLDSPALLGQAAPARGAVAGTGAFTSFVENMDRSLAFYHDVFGMDVPALPASGERAYNRPNPRLFAMFQINGSRERHQSARVPGTRLSLEFMEIQDIDHKTVELRMQDPGVAAPVLIVRDLDATLARVRQANASIVTPRAMPVKMGDGARAVLVRDIDGRPVELVQPASTPDAGATNNIVDIGLLLTVNDMNKTLHVYRDVLGFAVEKDLPNDKALGEIAGLPKSTVRHARVQPPGSTLAIDLVEFTGVKRTPLQLRIQDRGAARLQLRAQNLDALVEAMKAAGMSVVSEGGVAVPIPPNLRGALVADPNNFFFTPFEPCDGCATFGPAAGRQ
jgi:catechol 2,3-dioxygenase-like lactoylglutathione lyase family enzyme